MRFRILMILFAALGVLSWSPMTQAIPVGEQGWPSVMQFTINEPKGMLWRMTIFIIVIALTVILWRVSSARYSRQHDRGLLLTGIVVAVIGTAAGLVFRYAHACCDTPWYFYLGFPFSWLQGMFRSGGYYGLSFEDVMRQPSALKWWVGGLNLVLDLTFWFCAGTLLVRLSYLYKRSRNIPEKAI